MTDKSLTNLCFAPKIYFDTYRIKFMDVKYEPNARLRQSNV